MPKSPVTKIDAPTIAHQNDISRRTLLHSAATLAVHAAAAPVLHHLAIDTALAQVAENSKFAQVFNPYAAATNTGPSSLTIP
ncbi:MAG: hypothetical protein HOO99_09445, partial [Hyphomicrobiaceae bacterium]|nr:hypothetical protein [Hyphomicrobiaceae bacterium]